MLSQPFLLALLAALVVGSLVSFGLGLWKSGKHQAAAGMTALCGLKWRDFAHLIEDILQERGFTRANEERSPGDGGFDLLMTRGSSRYLVQCKNGAAHRVNEQVVRDLAAQVELKGAEGAVLATSGLVEPAAMQLAANRRIEILSDADLWRQVRHFMPHDLRVEVESRSRIEILKRVGMTAVAAVIAGVATAALIPPPGRSVDVVAAPTAVAPAVSPAPAQAPIASAPPELRPEIDTSLTEEQLAARRSATAMEVRNNPTIANAVWSTKSTLVVSLRQSGAEIPEVLFDEICRIVVQNEEQRYSRLQIESPAAEEGKAATVRWRQCR